MVSKKKSSKKNKTTLKDIVLNNVQNWPKIKKAIIKHYPEQKKNADSYVVVFERLTRIKPKKSKLKIEFDFGKNPDEEPYVDVHGVTKKDEQTWALDFTSWAEWLGMEVKEETIWKFSEIEILCHCLWEMTFYGFKETKIQKEFKLILDSYKEVKEDIKKGKIKLNDPAKKPKNK